jgi:hypothetical protein
VAAIKKTRIEEDMSLPPSFTKTFYRTLNRVAKEAGVDRVTFALKALRFYAAALKKRKSPVTRALGSDAETYTEQARKVSQNWWATLTAAEKTARAKKAIESRWGKKKK